MSVTAVNTITVWKYSMTTPQKPLSEMSVEETGKLPDWEDLTVENLVDEVVYLERARKDRELPINVYCKSIQYVINELTKRTTCKVCKKG